MKFTFLQFDICWEDKTKNFSLVESLLDSPLETDIILLPEMFSTGFSMNASGLAETMDGQSVEWMKSIAKEKKAAVLGSLIIEEKKNYYNRLIWASPNGEVLYYDKKHLFGLGNENRYYSAGNQHCIIDYKGVRMLPLICYDLRFPVWSRNTFGYDVLIYVANFPSARSHAWNSLLVARAIENQSYTFGVNRIGNDGNGLSYQGDSCCIDFQGNIISSLVNRQGCETVEIDLDKQNDFRAKFPFLKDMDAFSIAK